MSIATGQVDLDRVVTQIKSQALPDAGLGARLRKPKPSDARRPQKPQSSGVNSLADNAAFIAAMATHKPVAELPTLPLVTRTEYLDKPFLIWQPVYPNTALDQFLDYSIQPYSSWARMYVYTEGGRGNHTHLNIYYLWTNNHSDYADIDVDAPIVVTGVAFGQGSAGFFGGHNTTVDCHVSLGLWRWIGWGTDSTSGISRDQTGYPLIQQSQSANLADLSATGDWGPFGSAQSTFRRFDNEQFNIGATGIGVPPGASMLFTIYVDFIITMEGDTISDQAWIDFGSEGHFLSSPSMRLTIRTLT